MLPSNEVRSLYALQLRAVAGAGCGRGCAVTVRAETWVIADNKRKLNVSLFQALSPGLPTSGGNWLGLNDWL